MKLLSFSILVKRSLLFLLCGYGSLTLAQTNASWDTAPEQFKSYTTKDTHRLGLLYAQIDYNNMRDTRANAALLEEALLITEQVDKPKYWIQLLIYEGEQNVLSGDYKKGQDKILEALRLLETNPLPRENVQAHIVLSEINRENEALDEAVNQLSEAIKPLDPIKDAFLLGQAHLALANVYMNLYREPRFTNTLALLDKATNYFNELGSETGMALVMAKKARYHKIQTTLKQFTDQEKLEIHKQSLAMADKALPTFYKLNQPLNIAYALYQKATSYSIRGNHESSIPIYQEALESYSTIGSLMWVKRIHQHLFVAYSITGDQEKAMSENAKFVKIKDSIFGLEKRQLLAEAETKFDTERIQAARENAELKSKRNRNYLIGLGLISLLLLLASVFYIGKTRANKKMELVSLELRETQKRLALEKQYRDSELKALKAQMNPHFIFNALNSIQEYIILNQKELAGDYLGKFADLMRKYLNHSDAGFISLQEEVESLEMYLELEAIRFEDSFTYSIQIGDSITDEFVKIPTMLIQPYVENAIKHGLLHKKSDRRLDIQFSSQAAGVLTCEVLDNGVGRAQVKKIQAASLKRHKGFATEATKSRLDLLNYRKDQKIGVEIEDLFDSDSQACGTKVTISIPLKKDLL